MCLVEQKARSTSVRGFHEESFFHTPIMFADLANGHVLADGAAAFLQGQLHPNLHSRPQPKQARFSRTSARGRSVPHAA
jgi:hypothetical protein